jgi:enoyl-CoA hydratase/carnithine racemase
MSSPDHLHVERHDRCICIRLNRPDKANALSVGLMEDATRALTEAAGDAATGAIVLTGAGERVFSAGADVREQPADGDMAAHRRRRSAALAALIDGVIECPKPVVAALNGIASGGGAMLALLADARVSAAEAALSLPEIDLGLSTFMGAAIAEQIGGYALAVDLVQTGLVNAVVPRAELQTEALALAELLAKKDAKAFAANKQWLNRRMKAALAEARAAHEAHRGTHG